MIRKRARKLNVPGIPSRYIPGRPKQSLTFHTGKSLEELRQAGVLIDEPTYQECAEILRQVYEECGPSKAAHLVQRFEADRLREILVKQYPDFIRMAKGLLEAHRSLHSHEPDPSEPSPT